MTHTAKNNKKGLITSGAVILFSVVVASMASAFPKATMYINITAYIFLIAGLYVAIRFGISYYTYEVKDFTLNVVKTTGHRNQSVASLDLSTGEGIVKKPKTTKEKDEFRSRFGVTDRRMNLCTNLFAEKYVYVTEFNGKIYEIFLEVNDDFCTVLNGEISKKKNALHEE